MFDQKIHNWNLTNLSVVISNCSFGRYGKIEGFRNTDGPVFSHIEESKYLQFTALFWVNHKEYLFIAENIFGDLFLFDTKNLKWSRIGGKLHNEMYYFTKKQQFLFRWRNYVEIWSLAKY